MNKKLSLLFVLCTMMGINILAMVPAASRNIFNRPALTLAPAALGAARKSETISTQDLANVRRFYQAGAPAPYQPPVASPEPYAFTMPEMSQPLGRSLAPLSSETVRDILSKNPAILKKEKARAVENLSTLAALRTAEDLVEETIDMQAVIEAMKARSGFSDKTLRDIQELYAQKDIWKKTKKEAALRDVNKKLQQEMTRIALLEENILKAKILGLLKQEIKTEEDAFIAYFEMLFNLNALQTKDRSTVFLRNNASRLKEKMQKLQNMITSYKLFPQRSSL